jgi:hypothetical protein
MHIFRWRILLNKRKESKNEVYLIELQGVPYVFDMRPIQATDKSNSCGKVFMNEVKAYDLPLGFSARLRKSSAMSLKDIAGLFMQ